MSDGALHELKRLRRLLYRQLLHLRLGNTDRADRLLEPIQNTVERLSRLQLPDDETTRELLRSAAALNDEVTLRYEVERQHVAQRIFTVDIEQKIANFLRKD